MGPPELSFSVTTHRLKGSSRHWISLSSQTACGSKPRSLAMCPEASRSSIRPTYGVPFLGGTFSGSVWFCGCPIPQTRPQWSCSGCLHRGMSSGPVVKLCQELNRSLCGPLMDVSCIQMYSRLDQTMKAPVCRPNGCIDRWQGVNIATAYRAS